MWLLLDCAGFFWLVWPASGVLLVVGAIVWVLRKIMA